MLIPAGLPFSEAQTTNNLYKFDAGFYEQIQESLQELEDNARTEQGRPTIQQSIPTQSVMIVTDDGYEQQLQVSLRNINAEIIFIDTKLDYILANIPINQIIPLVSEDSVVKIADSTEPLEPQGLTMTQAKAVVGASNIPSIVAIKSS